ncbi:lymphocyte cytosolic protein 2-like [Watersipora subatra]|uniref:lymphocyte cytosolic protein 2-like n=1 Tax=Watersipora subatra TaxID=2589382 RepID=UPI00355BE1D8
MEMQLPVNGDVKHWGIPAVADWLITYKMNNYIINFQDQYVDGAKLLSLTQKDLKQLGVKSIHTGPMLHAIRTYNECNPDNDYEVSSEDDDDFNDDDDDLYNSMSSEYLPPDGLAEIQQQLRGATTAETEESNKDFEEEPVLPPRPGKPSNLVKPALEKIPPQKVQIQRAVPTPPEQTAPPPLNRNTAPSNSRPLPAQPPPSHETLTSLPETEAPAPPKNRPVKPGRGKRPPAPLPGQNLISSSDKPPPPPPHRPNQGGHISVEPAVPIGQSLEDEEGQTDYEEMDPCAEQQTYEIVEDTPEPSSKSSTLGSNCGSLGRRPAHLGALPKTPSDDEKESAGSANPPVNRFTPETKRAGAGRNQYPLVVLPVTKKKVIPSYTDHQLQSPPNSSSDYPSSPAPTIPVAKPPTVQKNSSLAAPTPPNRPSSHNTFSSSPSSSSTPSPTPDVSGMSIKERTKLLQAKGSSALTQGPEFGKKHGNMMAEMMAKQNERKNPLLLNNTKGGNHFTGKHTTSSEPFSHHVPSTKPPPHHVPSTKPLPPSKLPPSPGPQTVADSVDTPPPIPTSSHPGIQNLPASNGFHPPVPDSRRPPRRGSVSSNCSNLSNDEDRGLYGYSWYRSDMDRTQSMAQLKKRAGVRGAFLVRKSAKDPSKPYTLDVLYDEHEFHIPLRKRKDGHFAMGTAQANEDHWPSVPDLIGYFKTTSLALTRRVSGQVIKKSTVLQE